MATRKTKRKVASKAKPKGLGAVGNSGRFVKGDPRCWREGRQSGALSLVRTVQQVLGNDGRHLFGLIMARLLLTRTLELPSKAELMAAGVPAKQIPTAEKLSIEQYLSVIRIFCPSASKGDEDAGAVNFRSLLERVRAVNE